MDQEKITKLSTPLEDFERTARELRLIMRTKRPTPHMLIGCLEDLELLSQTAFEDRSQAVKTMWELTYEALIWADQVGDSKFPGYAVESLGRYHTALETIKTEAAAK